MAMTFNNPTYTYGNITVSNPTAITASNWGTTSINDHCELSNQEGSGVLELRGPRAEVRINDVGVTASIRAIEEALLIPGRLTRNPQLEQEFAELEELGKLYQQREQEFLEKRKMWNILKTTDQ
jgi:hypothetical protein